MVDPDIYLYHCSPKQISLIDSDYFWNENKPYSGKINVGPTLLENSVALISLSLSLCCLRHFKAPQHLKVNWFPP